MDAPVTGVWMKHRVSYGETDAMGVVYYAEYLHIFERSRNSICRACAIPYDEIEKAGIILPVREAQCRYRSPARYDDLLWVHVWISEWKRASVRFSYEIRSEDRKTLIAEGMTEHVIYSREAGRPVATPQWLKDAFSSIKVEEND